MKLFLAALLLLNIGFLNGQTVALDNSDADKEYQKEYKKNIKLSKIRGVYIPPSIEEAINRLEKLSPASAMSKFASAPEVEVCPKLHFGLGRWMIQNWNFYAGSRISHVLKTSGVLHPDDMAQFLLRSLHRKLNNKALDSELLVDELARKRKKITQEALGL